MVPPVLRSTFPRNKNSRGVANGSILHLLEERAIRVVLQLSLLALPVDAVTASNTIREDLITYITGMT
jgi:hypothetical protein